MRHTSQHLSLLLGLLVYLSTSPLHIIATAEDLNAGSRNRQNTGRHVLVENDLAEIESSVYFKKKYQMKIGRGLKFDKLFLSDMESVVKDTEENKKGETESDPEGGGVRGKKKGGKKTGKKAAKKEGKEPGKKASEKAGKGPGEKAAKKEGKKPGEKSKKKPEKKTQKKHPETSSSPSPSPVSPAEPPTTSKEELEVHEKTIKELAHIEPGYWRITDEVLTRIHNDLMVIINMTKSGDVIAFAASETVQPATTMIITHNLKFTSAVQSESEETTPDTRQVLTCPDSGPLLKNKAPRLMFANLTVTGCEASGAKAIIIINRGTSASFYNDLFANNTFRVLTINHNARIQASSVLFENNTMQGKKGQDPVDGGNVLCDGPGSKAEFKSCSFLGNVAEGSGGAIVAYGCDVFVFNCTFRGNKAGISGGAIKAEENAHLEVLSSSFQENTASTEGAIAAVGFSAAKIRNSLFVNNTVVEYSTGITPAGGAASALWYSYLDISYSTFKGNKAVANGGGVSFSEGSSGTVSNSAFYDNRAENGGGGIAVERWSDISMKHLLFKGNDAQYGAGVFVVKESYGTVQNCAFLRNTVNASGGAISVAERSKTSVNRSLFAGNKARDNGGAVNAETGSIIRVLSSFFSGNTALDAGGAVFIHEDSVATMNYSLFLNNTANVDKQGGSSIGGAIGGVINSSLQIWNSNFSNNNAAYGGGVFFGSETSAIIWNCKFQNNTAYYSGGAILVVLHSNASVENSLFLGNGALNGAGVGAYMHSNATISRCAFYNNTAINGGGGVAVRSDSIASVDYSRFAANKAFFGAAVSVFYNAEGRITNCMFFNNTVDDGGGAVQANSDARVSVMYSQFKDNSARVGGAISMVAMISGTIAKCAFLNNTAREEGGAIYLYFASRALVEYSYFTGNQAGLGAGAILTKEYSTLKVLSSYFKGNFAKKAGGAVLVQQKSTATISNSSFVNNTALEHEEGIDGMGGGICALKYSNIEVSNSAFKGNHANASGGGVCFSETSSGAVSKCVFFNNKADSGGSGVVIERGSNATVEDSFFVGNDASYGAGVYVYAEGNGTVTSCTFVYNVVDGTGGAIAITNVARASVKYSRFIKNYARVGGAIGVDIGANSTIEECVFLSNVANDTGGGVLVAEYSTVSLHESQFIGNEARNGAGVAVYFYSNAVCTNCTFMNNTASREGYVVSLHVPRKPLLWPSRFFGINSNVAGVGGGVCVSYHSNTTLRNCSFLGNTADDKGGAIEALRVSKVSVEWTEIRRNKAEQGGGIYLDSSVLDFSDSEVVENLALESGNSIKAIDSKILFDKKTMIKGNITIDGDICRIQTQPTSAEEPNSEDEDLLVKEAILET